MKVRKTEPGMIRKAEFSVRKAGQGIRTSRIGIKKGLTSSVIGEEEQQKKAAHTSGKADAAQVVFRKNSRKQSSIPVEQDRLEGVEKAAYGKMLQQRNRDRRTSAAGQNVQQKTDTRMVSIYGNYDPETSAVRYRQRSNPSSPVSSAQYGDRVSVTGRTVGAGKAAGRRTAGTAVTGTAGTGSAAAAGTAGKALGSRTGAGGAAVAEMAGTAKTAAAGMAKTAVEGTAAAGTGGTVFIVKAAAKAAERAKDRMQGALEASVTGKRDNVLKGQPEDIGQKRSGGKGEGTRILFLLALFPAIFFITVIALLALIFPAAFIPEQSSADRIVEVAKQEAEAWEENIGGTKYKNWYGMDENWCAMFVSWCANECGYIDSDVMPKAASVSVMRSWYMGKEQYYTKESGYEPQAGDVIFFGNGRSHTGLVVEYDQETGTVVTIEGNTGSSDTSPYHQGSRVKEKRYPLTHVSIIGYGSPLYPEGTVEIPEPYGTEYSYMGWQMITSPSSKQYKLREEAGMNFDENGFGKIGDRYVIACTLTFGQVGDYVDWELDNGTVIKTVIGDIKNQNDEGCNKWGHRNGLCVLEFVVDKASWYGSGKYPTDFHADWEGRTVRAARTGNYWR